MGEARNAPMAILQDDQRSAWQVCACFRGEAAGHGAAMVLAVRGHGPRALPGTRT
jgi:hypothetical protein